MSEPDVFADAAFLGLARTSKRDPYRLSLFAEHLAQDERALAVLPIRGGTLLVTDRRLLDLEAHLEVHGAWNVKEFRGYAVRRAIERSAVLDVTHEVRSSIDGSGNRRVEDRLVVATAQGPEAFLVSKGPEPTLSDADFGILRAAVRDAHTK